MDNIIRMDQGIILENAGGARLEIWQENGKYGLGTFYYKGVRAGAAIDQFLYEDSHYVWDRYQADRYEIVENTPDRGTITFYGTFGANNIESNWLATVTLTADSPAYRLDLQVEPYMWPGRYHPLYVCAPFENQNLECVSYPMEAPILPPYDSHWTIRPDVGKVPLLIGRQKADGGRLHVGIGYVLDVPEQDYAQGALWYDSTKPGCAMRADFPYLHYWIPAQHTWDINCSLGARTSAEGNQLLSGYFRHGDPYRCTVVISIADTQAKCVFGYKDMCGYNNDTCTKYDVMKAVDSMLAGYNTDAPWIYEKEKGYRMRGWSDSDEKANYYDFITFTSNAILSYLLYNLWRKDHTQIWAKERAVEMTDFAIGRQLSSGAFPRCWDVDEDHPHGMGDCYYELGVVYDPMVTGACAQYIDLLAEAMEQEEGKAPLEWIEAARKAIDWVVHMIEKENGALQHSYTAEERGIFNAIEPYALHALRYFYHKTKDQKYLKAMELNELYIQETFGKNNDWYNGLTDCNNLAGSLDCEQTRNYYTLNVFDLAGYYHDRYQDTGDEKYLDWAKDHFAFGWMGRMPVNMPDFHYQTKGIIEEQNIWVFYDLPWPFNSSAGLARMARTLDDPFYAEYYKLAVNTQLEFAHFGEKHPFCSQVLGAAWDRRAPLDRFAEIVDGKHGVWITGYSTLFIHDMLGPDTYFYQGGKTWGVGLDYEPDFNPDFGEYPCLVACTSRVSGAKWEKDTFRARLEGLPREKCELIFKMEEPAKEVNMWVDGIPVETDYKYDPLRKELLLFYSQQKTAIDVTIRIV